MNLGGTSAPDQTARHGSLAERNALVSGFRRWGMQYTVFKDGDFDNTYYLSYNENSTNISDNANWVLASSVLGSWVPTLTTDDASAVQNTVTSDISGQTGTKTFSGMQWDVTETGRLSTGTANHLHFQKNGNDVFKVSLDGLLYGSEFDYFNSTTRFGFSGAQAWISRHSPPNKVIFTIGAGATTTTAPNEGISLSWDAGTNTGKLELVSPIKSFFSLKENTSVAEIGMQFQELSISTNSIAAISIDSSQICTVHKYQILTEVTAPIGTPAAGTMYFYADSADSKPKFKNDTGAVFEVGGVDIETIHLQLTQSQIQNLNTTPIEIFSAPGPGKYIQIIGASAFLDHNGTDYAVASNLELVIGNIQWKMYGLIDRNVGFTQIGTSVAGSDTVFNSALMASADADATGNGGTIDIYVQYTVINTN